GYTVGVKDLLAVRGQPIGAGSAVRSEAVPEPRDAAIVASLRACGAVVVGRTTLHEFAFGVTGLNLHAGTPANPSAPGCIPGGSSSGSAVAVASGSARVAVGTDTGGSIRIPAALCGVVGFKPAHDTYPAGGVLPLAPSLDTVGLLGADVQDVATVHEALGGRVEGHPPPTRIGVVRAGLEGADAAVAGAVEDALTTVSRRGCELVDVAWPDADAIHAASTTIMFAEAAASHRDAMAASLDAYGDDVRERLEIGASITDAEYAAADRERARLTDVATSALDGVDCVIGPTVGVPPPTGEQAADSGIAARLVAHTRLANLARLPALSLPAPCAGQPIGLQLTASTDRAVLSIARWLERELALAC
ncbi:MAG: amidase, partial [Thermoleophilaceae bacterium]